MRGRAALISFTSPTSSILSRSCSADMSMDHRPLTKASVTANCASYSVLLSYMLNRVATRDRNAYSTTSGHNAQKGSSKQPVGQ